MICAALRPRLALPHIPRMSHIVVCRLVLNLLSIAAALAGWLCATSTCAHATHLDKETEAAFQRYVHSSEARMERELAAEKPFLMSDGLPQPEKSQTYGSLRSGQILIERTPQNDPSAPQSVQGALIHDWTGSCFIPGVSISQVLAVLQNYDRDSDYYRPEVSGSKLLQHSDNEFRVFLRIRQIHGITVVFDTEYDIRYRILDAAHAYSRSYSTRIAEVENAGERDERDRPVGDDRGFLWRLYSYWRFYQGDGGVYVQCNAISLTRDVPVGLGWLVRPFLENIPRDSLRFTLDATRKAVLNNRLEESKRSRTAVQSNRLGENSN
jgi:hypothetical protein